MLSKITPDVLFDLQGAGEALEDTKEMGLSGKKPLGEAKTKDSHHKDESPLPDSDGPSVVKIMTEGTCLPKNLKS